MFQDYYHNGYYSLGPDEFILFLNAVCKEFPSPTIKVEVWNSSAYWLFHDIIHSLQHKGKSRLFVNEYLELEAFYLGLLLALQHGIPLWECMREIHAVGEQWRGEDYDWNTVLKEVYDAVFQKSSNTISLWGENDSLYQIPIETNRM
jgi:hypothetical protein